jgi:hypothetical protein
MAGRPEKHGRSPHIVVRKEVHIHPQGPTLGGMIGAAARGIGAATSAIVHETARAVGDMSISVTISVCCNS